MELTCRSKCVFLEELYHKNGKIDWDRLPRPQGLTNQEAPYVPPRNANESQLVDIFSEILKFVKLFGN